MSPKPEVIAPFRFPRDRTPPVTEVRSTLLTASLQGMRVMGWEARYFAALAAPLHDRVRGLVAGSWLPVAEAESHYRACDAMALSKDEVRKLGEAVSERTQQTFVGTIVRTAGGAGATPWHLYANAHRVWDRMIRGADQCVYRLGPKEALVELVGCSLLSIPYFRSAVGAYYRAAATGLSRAVFVHDEPKLASPTSVGIRVSWA